MQKTLLRILIISVMVVSAGCTRSAGKATIELPPTSTLSPTQPAPLPTQTRIPSTEAATPTSAPSITPAAIARVYAVAYLGQDDLLNLRTSPGLNTDVLETLDPFTRDLEATGKQEEADNQVWLEIQRPDSKSGWLSTRFITEQIEPDAFCSDERINKLLDDFALAIKNKDGELLASLVNPLHGLTIQHNWWNPAVTLDSREAVQNLLISTTDFDWGTENGSGLPIVGPFKDNILPKLQDVLSGNYTRHCNILESGVSAGGTAGMLNWPAEFTNLNYMALFRAAPSTEDELNWRTWTIGFEYVGGIPYIAVLVQYYWEI